jgi:hypothetical protein
MFFQNVNSRVPETLQGLQVQRHDEPAPEIAKLLLRSFDPEFKRAGDPNVGEFSDAVVLMKFGDVPNDLSEL